MKGRLTRSGAASAAPPGTISTPTPEPATDLDTTSPKKTNEENIRTTVAEISGGIEGGESLRVTLTTSPPPPGLSNNNTGSEETGITILVASPIPIQEVVTVEGDQNAVSDGGRGDGSGSAQMSPQLVHGSGQTSTPNSPNDNSGGTPNPPTPGTNNSNNSNTIVESSPHYVTITGDGSANRSYASLTPVNASVVDGETVTGDGVGENAAYVTYVDDTGTDHTTLYAAAAAAAAANGQTMTYPVYTVGTETATTMYSPGGSGTTQYYATTANSSAPTAVAYAQESGVAYLVPSSANNNNNINVEAANDGQHNMSHATRVSPATGSELKIMKAGFGPGNLFKFNNKGIMSRKNAIQHINYPPAKIRRIEAFETSQSQKANSFSFAGGESTNVEDEEGQDYIPIPPPVVVMETASSDSSDDDYGSGEDPLVLNNPGFDTRHSGTGGLDMGRLNNLMSGSMGGGSGSKRGAGSLGAAGSSRYCSLDGLSVPSSNVGISASSPNSNQGESSGGSSAGAFGGIFSSAAKFCHATVQWLLENYETAEGVSLPRSTLYFHYLRHCNEHKLDPVNAASFGKLIRSVFLGLRTRRLGTRGNSKYHYYGIRLKPTSPLVHVTENGDSSPSSQQGGCNSPGSASGGDGDGGTPAKKLKPSKGEHYEVSHHGVGVNMSDPFSIQQFLGDPSNGLENLPEFDMKIQVPNELNVDDLLIFRTLYREHCEALLETMANFQLSQVETYWRQFWRNNASQADNIDQEYEKMLPKSKLHLLCTIKEVQEFIRETDYQFYQNVVGLLLPDVLRPIPSSMTQAIRNFAKTLETWLTGAMHGYPSKIVTIKISCVNALAQTLRRYTSLNHLAQAARAVLQNQNQISQMLSDLNRVDFHNVEEQASWVCGCDGEMVPSLEQDFKTTLAQQHTLEQWATWLEGVVDKILRPHVNSPKFVQAARHFLLKWSFYSSLVIRDLTLRSAASFGSFHLLRLLYDEYMFYLVEHRVAQVTGIVPIAVIGKKSLEALTANISPSSSVPNRRSDESSPTSLRSASHSRVSANNTNGGGHETSAAVSSVSSATHNGQQSRTSLQPNATVVTSSANVNVHMDANNTVGVIVPKSEIKRVKNFLTV